MPTPTTPLLSAIHLAQALHASAVHPVLLDASFDLADPGAGERAFAQAHVPGARHVHLDRDLCGPKTGRNGRHPLPTREAWAATLGRLGVRPDSEVVVMDRANSMFAARLWWMLLWAGHPAARVRVLDGGVQAWVAAGAPVEQGLPAAVESAPHYPVSATPGSTLEEAAGVLALLPALAAGSQRLVDARAPERYRGEVEPLDPAAGHIPGALNRPFTDNLEADGRFKPADALRAAWAPVLGPDAAAVVHQCGSGVTACHNLLATVAAGYPLGRLYAGSWSEWCADPARPVARGANPAAASAS